MGESMRLREANGKMAIQLTKAEIDEVIKTHLLNRRKRILKRHIPAKNSGKYSANLTCKEKT